MARGSPARPALAHRRLGRRGRCDSGAEDGLRHDHRRAFKYGVIVPLSEELVALSTPDAEATVRRTVLGGLAAALDNQFLLPTVAVSAGVNPGSVTNGSTEITTTGTTAAQIAADLPACWRR